MAAEGWFTQIARSLIDSLKRLGETEEAKEEEGPSDNISNESEQNVPSSVEVISSLQSDESDKNEGECESDQAAVENSQTGWSHWTFDEPFKGYHLDMTDFYSQAVKSLPKYRRDELVDGRTGYIQTRPSKTPCSPRLVHRNNQKQVVTKMLRSYPQADGSFVCPVPQPSKHNDDPPPPPAKWRDRHLHPTIPTPNEPQRGGNYQNQNQRGQGPIIQPRPLLYESKTQYSRSTSLQPATANDLYKPAYTRTHSNNTHLSHTTVQAQRAVTIKPPTAKSERRERPTSWHHTSATFVREPGGAKVVRTNSQLSNVSEASNSTFTGSMEATEERDQRSSSRSSSTEYAPEGDAVQNVPELYPEHRVEMPLRIRSRSHVKMTSFDMLHNAHHVLEFLSHKVDILQESLQLFTDKLNEMSDLAVTTPPCTQIDTEFCICHQAFDSTRLGTGIWKYFCDANKCNFCCQLFDKLANRPNSSCQLSMLDLNLNIILSGALVIAGKDNGGLVVFIKAQSEIWSNCDEDCLHDLSNFLEYTSATVRDGHISVVVDARQAFEAITQLIMNSLQHTQRNTKGAIVDASVIVDRPSHTPQRLLKPLGTAGSTTVVEIDFCSLDDCALKLGSDKLPVQLGGSYTFDPDSWIRSYACLEKKIQQHQRAFREIFSSTHSLSLVPRTIRHAGNVIHQHKNAVDVIDRTTKLLDRSKYTEEGSRYPPDVDDVNSCNILRDAEIRQLLEDLNSFMTGTHVFRDVMDSLQSLGQTRREVTRLKELAEERLSKLHGCKKLWSSIEEITKTLTLLKKAHELLNKHRVVSHNLKSAQVQFTNFNKIKPSVMKLVSQGNDLLAESKAILSEVKTPILWLEQLSAKLQSELSCLVSFLEKTELLVTDTYHCYEILNQAYDWAVESMKFVSSMNMNECLSEDGVEKLSTNLTSFIKAHKIIDQKVFDDVALKAKNLGNGKLTDQCRIARARCEETRQVLKVRESTIVKAKEEIEAQKAKRVSLEQLSANTNITPLTKHATTDAHVSEDIWLPQSTPQPNSNRNHGDTNNNKTAPPSNGSSSPDQRLKVVKCSHSRTKSEDTGLTMVDVRSVPSTLTESLDTMASSQDDIVSRSDSQSDILETGHQVSPMPVSEELKENSMVKRRSFAGFTNANSFPSFNDLSKVLKHSTDQRLSDNVSEIDEGLATVDDDSSCHSNADMSKSVVEKLEELGIDGTHRKKTKAKKDLSLRDSVITGSSESLTSFHEDQEVLTEDSGALTKSSSSSASHDSGHVAGNSSNLWSPVPVNSHLLQKKSTHQWQSMSDLRLTEAEVHSRRTLSHIMDELIQTEKDYVMALKLVVEKYIPELNREDVPQALRGNRGVIFGNIEKIYDFHNHHFLKELLECDQEPFRVSQCFIDHEKEFLMYALYNKNKPRSDILMSEHGTPFFRQLQTSLGDKMDLSSYLLKPVQRMGKYALILKQILKECPESAAEHQDLSAAQEIIKFSLQHGNDLLAMDSLKECDVNLQEQGTLLLQGEFTVQKSRHKAAKRHLFLFDDLLVFAKAKKMGAGQDEYIYKSSLKTADLGLTENVGGSGNKFEIWFRKRSRENWTMQASSAQVKNKWVSTFEKILWNQAIKNRESRLTELSSMGIGHKPSLDLKPSEDNISERTISHKGHQKKPTQESKKSALSKRISSNAKTSSSPISVPIATSISSLHSSSASSLNSHPTSNHSASRNSDVSKVSGLHITSSTNDSIIATGEDDSKSKPDGLSQQCNKKENALSNTSNQSASRVGRLSSSHSAAVLTLLEEPMSLHESKV